jgi:hypothetical protein
MFASRRFPIQANFEAEQSGRPLLIRAIASSNGPTDLERQSPLAILNERSERKNDR